MSLKACLSLFGLIFLVINLIDRATADGSDSSLQFFQRGDEAVINQLGYLATGYDVYGLNVSFYRLNYVNPGRVVLFNGIDSLYPSIELAPFAAQDLADLKNTFSGQFYHLSLKQDNAESTLALISQVVAESTPGMKLSGSFEAQYADIFTWENISYTSSRAAFQATITADDSGNTVAIFTFGTVSHSTAAKFQVRSTISMHNTNTASTALVSFPDHQYFTGSNVVGSSRPGVFVFKVDAVNCYEEDLASYVCINDLPRNFTTIATNTSSATFSFQDKTHPGNMVNFTIKCLGPDHTRSMRLNQEEVQTLGTVTVAKLKPFHEYQCMVKKSHVYGTVQPFRYLDIFTGKKSAPSVPVDLALVDKGPTYIVLNWTSPDPLLTGLPPAEGYLISSTNGILDYVLTNTSVNVSSLSPLTTYTFMVSANNSYGTSKFSLPVTMTTLEAAFEDASVGTVFSVRATVTLREVFSSESDKPVVYLAICSANGNAVTSVLDTNGIVGGTHTLTVTNLSPDTPYNCSITRYNSITGMNMTKYVDFTTGPPEPPPDVEVNNIAPSTATISIGALFSASAEPSQNISYVILCVGNGTSNGNVSAISSTLNASSIAGGINQVVLSGLSPATTYNCSVTAYNFVTGASITQEVTFTTEQLPGENAKCLLLFLP
jgi:hypothetical protein